MLPPESTLHLFYTHTIWHHVGIHYYLTSLKLHSVQSHEKNMGFGEYFLLLKKYNLEKKVIKKRLRNKFEIICVFVLIIFCLL